MLRKRKRRRKKDNSFRHFNKKGKTFAKNITLIELPNNKEYYCFMSSQPYLVNKINPYLLGFLESEQWNKLLRKYGINE